MEHFYAFFMEFLFSCNFHLIRNNGAIFIKIAIIIKGQRREIFGHTSATLSGCYSKTDIVYNGKTFGNLLNRFYCIYVQ